MDPLISFLRQPSFKYEPLIEVHISRSRLIHNLNAFMKLAPQGNIAPVLKSNAYGHGLIEVARIMEHEHKTHDIVHNRGLQSEKKRIPFLAVDSYFEAAKLRNAKIRMPLLVIGYTRPEVIAHGRLRNVSFMITSLDNLKEMAQARSPFISRNLSHSITIHLKIDTGMHRHGILPEELEEVIHILNMNPHIILKGICSHFSDADNPDPSFTEAQIKIWNDVVARIQHAYASLEFIHISNTDGHLYVSDSNANLSRLGIGLYGITGNTALASKLDLKPALSLHTIITGIKKLKSDETVGYSNTFKAERDMLIATIPVGYSEGLDRRLSNQGIVLVGNEKIPCRIIGRVCMNITMIDVTHIHEPKTGMPVIVISNDESQENSVVAIAEKCATIPHEILVHIPEHLRRTIVD